MPLTARRPTQQLVDLVGTLGGTWHGYVAMCRCPAHSDTTPSLSIRQGDSDILVTCFAGCARDDVLRELRRVRADRHYPSPAEAGQPRVGNVDRLWDQADDVRGTISWPTPSASTPLGHSLPPALPLSSEAKDDLRTGAAGRSPQSPSACRGAADLP